ncbi:MAG: MerR family transcriptional regulator [Ruminococcaceae bacterium]|nr:MerR family transcriptional regulator [Oscillospiraceae bacterium]
MKIKEVCALTGLTERTVRYYEEEKLISPKTTESNGRTYRNYSTEDASDLKVIAELRKADLSIDEIRLMKKNPKKIGIVMEKYLSRLTEEVESKSVLLEIFANTDFSDIKSISALASKLSAGTAGRPLPRCDVEPDFSRFEPEKPEDKEAAFYQYQQRQRRLYNTGQIIVITIAIINIVTSIISQFLSGFNLFSLILNIILSFCLFMGVSWVRWLFAVSAAVSVFFQLMLFISISSEGMETGLLLLLIFEFLYSAASTFLLFAHRGVSEFLYTQKNG